MPQKYRSGCSLSRWRFSPFSSFWGFWLANWYSEGEPIISGRETLRASTLIRPSTKLAGRRPVSVVRGRGSLWTIWVFQREQESARGEVQRRQQLAVEQEAGVQPLLAQYESSRAQTQKAIQDLEAKASSFLDQTTNLQFANIDRTIEVGQEAVSLGQKAQASYSETSKAVSSLTRFAQSSNQRDRLRYKDAEFEQLHTVFDRIQAVFARVKTAFQQIQRIQARWQPCSQRLIAAGVPNAIIETKIFSANGDQDSHLFEMICPSNNTPLIYSGPSGSSKLLQFELGNTPVRLWFVLRDDDGSKTWSKALSGDSTPTSRLVLRRVNSGSTDKSAQANWESVNLLNTAALLLALSK